MADKTHEQDTLLESGSNPMTAGAVSRREFLKVAGIAGATIGVAGGLGGLVAACGEAEETTTTTAGATTTTSATATTAAAGPEVGREIKIGYVTSITGAMASFGEPAEFLAQEWQANIWKDGLVLGDNKKHPIKLIVRDGQSDTNRSAQVAQDLVSNDQVDILSASGSEVTAVPVSDSGEAFGCPTLTNETPDVIWYYGRGGSPEGWKWTYHYAYSIEQVLGALMKAFAELPTNKVVGGLWSNDGDGLALSDPKTGMPPLFTANGYTVIDPGRPNVGAEDYSDIISEFKKAGVEIISTSATPADFSNFMQQSVQASFKPKMINSGKVGVFPSGVEAMGDLGDGLLVGSQWNRAWPYASSLTGITCEELAAKYEAETGNQVSAPVGYYSLFEVITDVLKRATNPEDKESVIAAAKVTNVDTVAGRIAYDSPIPNVCWQACAVDQWFKGTGKWKYEEKVVCASDAYPEIKPNAEQKYMTYPA